MNVDCEGNSSQVFPLFNGTNAIVATFNMHFIFLEMILLLLLFFIIIIDILCINSWSSVEHWTLCADGARLKKLTG